MKLSSMSAPPNARINVTTGRRGQPSAMITSPSNPFLLVLVENSLLVRQGLGDKRLDGHFHQFERERDGTADMNFMLVV